MRKREEGGVRVAFWNVVEVLGKDKEFWKGLENLDVMVSLKIWVERKDGGK